jgi:hypothetical protein
VVTLPASDIDENAERRSEGNPILVTTLCVVTLPGRSAALPASDVKEDAERPQRHSRAERGNEGMTRLRNPPVPRHREIAESLCRLIKKQLGIS